MSVRASTQGVFSIFLLMTFSSFVASREPDKPFAHFPLTDADVDSAIQSGLTLASDQVGLRLTAASDDVGEFQRVYDERLGHWLTGGGLSTPTTGFVVEVFTPYSWIQKEASLRAAEGGGMTTDDVTREMKEPLLRVLCHPNTPLKAREGVLGVEVERVSLRSTAKKDWELLEPAQTERLATPVRVGTAIVADIGPLLASFPMEEVSRIADLDPKGEFYIVIVSAAGEEKELKVKTKHFSRLP